MMIRPAIPADATAIARVHVDTWRHAYRDLVPEDYLANLSYAELEEMWRRVMSEGDDQAGCVFVAEEGGAVCGFASGRPRTQYSQDLPEYEGELQTLYVHPSRQGTGAGWRLMGAIARCLAERGVSSMLLWVFKENAPARRFYESLGGTLIGEDSFVLGGAELSEVAYGWADLIVLLANTAAPD